MSGQPGAELLAGNSCSRESALNSLRAILSRARLAREEN